MKNYYYGKGIEELSKYKKDTEEIKDKYADDKRKLEKEKENIKKDMKAMGIKQHFFKDEYLENNLNENLGKQESNKGKLNDIEESLRLINNAIEYYQKYNKN